MGIVQYALFCLGIRYNWSTRRKWPKDKARALIVHDRILNGRDI